MDQSTTYPRFERNIPYGVADRRSRLNTVDVCLPRPSSAATADADANAQRIWVIYIHGGAWRDPDISSTSFEPALSILLRSPVLDDIAGFASVNYRLSPYPAHATRPSDAGDGARNVTHPAHRDDVLEALVFLQRRYAFGHRYLLVGHSCGATLAWQVVMPDEGASSAPGWPARPRGVVGVAGIYDFQGLRERHRHLPGYEDLLHNAFGPAWESESAAPVVWLQRVGRLRDTWPEAELVVLASSERDELVEMEQASMMAQALRETRHRTLNRTDELITLHASHDAICSEGTELAMVIAKSIDRLKRPTAS
ncbi:MAG: hypothetical protein M1826_001225 [Phylliscum demangeonii]|nr:MAG: hypothetical protein M1826_001225 [Phylliscum demangeonii]